MENQSCIHIAFGAGEQTNVVVGRMNEGDTCELDDWCFFGGLGRYDRVAKVHNFIAAGIVAELSIDKDVSFLVAYNN